MLVDYLDGLMTPFYAVETELSPEITLDEVEAIAEQHIVLDSD